ncbi:MAG: SRPBCC family protein [Planctomycetes bacterium]|nr:SRPBCC family protein [Planctomycetota bacterium]
MQSEASIEIDRPIDEVFRLTHEDVAEWSIVVVEDEVIDEKPEGVGTTFRTVTEDHGKRMEFQGVITAYDPPHSIAIEMIGQMFDIQVAYAFEDLGGRTKATQFSNVTGKGFMKLFFLLFGWMMNKANCDAQDNELNNLKQYCEITAGHQQVAK